MNVRGDVFGSFYINNSTSMLYYNDFWTIRKLHYPKSYGNATVDSYIKRQYLDRYAALLRKLKSADIAIA